MAQMSPLEVRGTLEWQERYWTLASADKQLKKLLQFI